MACRDKKSLGWHETSDRRVYSDLEAFHPDIVAKLNLAVETINPALLQTQRDQNSESDQPDELYEDSVEVQEAPNAAVGI